MSRSEKQRAKDRAWSWFSKFIRLRDCLQTTGTATHGRCFTCGAYKPFEELQAGHGIPGRGYSILFDEDIVHAQCARCNKYEGGNYVLFNQRLRKIYGDSKVIEFWDQAAKIVQLKAADLRGISSRYRIAYYLLKKRSMKEKSDEND